MSRNSRLADSFRNFSKTFARFQESSECSRDDVVLEKSERGRQNDYVQELVNEREKARRDSVLRTWKLYKEPFIVMGKNSARAKAIDDDEQALVKAYNLYKSVVGLNESHGDENTFLAHVEIETPLTKKDSYTNGNLFIYLQAWFMFSQKISDYIPVIEEKSENIFELRFEFAKEFRFTQEKFEFLEIIREAEGISEE